MLARHEVGPESFGWFGWVFPLLVLLLVIAVGALVFYLWRNRSVSTTRQDPVRTAAMRLALGEMTISEFEQLRLRLEAAETAQTTEATGAAEGSESGDQEEE